MASLPPDPYKILGVSKDAQAPAIRSAHRKLVLKCHPDKVQDPKLKALKQDEFQKVQQAYELLSDETARQRYDDKIKLEDLRKQFHTKANVSSPRSSPRYAGYDDTRGQEYRASPFKASSTPPAASKTYVYTSSDDDYGRGPRVVNVTPRMARRETSYAEKPPRREAEREKDRDVREGEREREKDKDRRRRPDDTKRGEKDAKEARRVEREQRKKQRDKDIKRDADEKKHYTKPYIEPFDDEPQVLPKSDKKKSSSGKKDDKRDRSSGRDDTAGSAPSPPRPSRSWTTALNYAASYIEASRVKSGGAPPLHRSATYNPKSVNPPAPTPPPVGRGFSVLDDEVRRSSAKSRRGSADSPRLSRDRSYRDRQSSKEVLDDPNVVNVSPSTRQAAQFSRSGPGTPVMSPSSPSSPPRGDLPRTKTMPPESSHGYSRSGPAPGITRAQTFNVVSDAGAEFSSRGRNRSRMYAQVDDSDSDDVYERRRDRKGRSSRVHYSPEPIRAENVSRYQVDAGRARLHSSYQRRVDQDSDSFGYYPPGTRTHARPSMPARESSYSRSGSVGKFSKTYGYDDVNYSSYHEKPYREGFSAYA